MENQNRIVRIGLPEKLKSTLRKAGIELMILLIITAYPLCLQPSCFWQGLGYYIICIVCLMSYV